MLSTDTKKKDIFVTYLKVAACLLITNSHCKNIYPHFFLAVGGGWGNALFFILSGYCLAHINTRFLVWYKKRLIRIVPPLLLTIFFNVLFIDGIWHTLSMECSTFFSYYINKYWFGFTILIFYIAFYFIFRIQNITRIAAILMIHIAIYLAIYCFLVDKSYFCIELEGFSPFKIYFYFGIFLVGGLLRLISPKIEAIFSTKVPPPQKNTKSLFLMILLIVSILIWGSTYTVIILFHRGYVLQCLIHASVLLFSVVCLLLAFNYEKYIKELSGKLGQLISCIADSTFEIYLVQVTFVTYISRLPFPVNWFFFLSASVTGGILFHNILLKLPFFTSDSNKLFTDL